MRKEKKILSKKLLNRQNYKKSLRLRKCTKKSEEKR